ncbi:MAG: hypothetical protein M0Q53_09230 [Prolixibacteraceae bacterium]|nr:hypothetical protein [Prolixibacteraceae bacterium]
MSEFDYHRGLRGGDCRNYDGQAYRDWLDGNQEYERIQGEIEAQDERNYQDSLSSKEREARQEERRRNCAVEEKMEKERQAKYRAESKENAYKEVDTDKLGGIVMGAIWFFVILVGGNIAQWFLDLFKVHIPSIAIWIAAIFMFVVLIIQGNSIAEKDRINAKNKYGERN